MDATRLIAALDMAYGMVLVFCCFRMYTGIQYSTSIHDSKQDTMILSTFYLVDPLLKNLRRTQSDKLRVAVVNRKSEIEV